MKTTKIEMKKASKRIKMMPPTPRVAGIGLVALDLVWSTDKPEIEFAAGGTCGNVLAILAYLGWKATPISRIGTDIAGSLVKDDLARWGTDTKHLSLKPTARTPVIVEKIRSDRNGIPFHTFSFYCPSCNRRFPGFQPVTAKAIDPAKTIVENADILFIDRVSKSAAILADVAANAGVTVVFEPASVKESRSFSYILETADIVKYSHDRIDELPRSSSKRGRLDIQTLGRGGLRFRGPGETSWQHLQAEATESLVDAAGSGDWLTAGLLYALQRMGRPIKDNLKQENLIRALTVGQKLAAWNCSFRGARGGMYSVSKSRIPTIIAETLAISSHKQIVTREQVNAPTVARDVCLNCSGGNVASVRITTAKRAGAVVSRPR